MDKDLLTIVLMDDGDVRVLRHPKVFRLTVKQMHRLVEVLETEAKAVNEFK